MSNSKYSFWTWLIAIILAIYLFWQWQNGHGMGACCATPATPATAAPVPTAQVVTAPVAEVPANAEIFTCKATADKFESTGSLANVAWANKSTDLSAWLKAGGADWQAACIGAAVTLTGTVDSDEAKAKAGAQAQAFFGDKTSVDNQLMIKAAEKAPEPATATTQVPTANLYFDTAKTHLAADASTTLTPIIEWLKANPNTKVAISGYHDPRGGKARNIALAKNRAKAVREALKAAGIDEARIEMRKPVSTEGSGDLAEARRVEVTVE
ncbi:MAG: OmpA family protein [Methylophilaceae bacterium]